MAGMRCSAIVLALCLPVALAACGDGTPTAAIPLPSYGIGDTYGFDDGSVQTVVGTEGDDVYWRDDKASLVTTRDVLLPPLETRSPGGTIRRQLQHRRIVSVDAGQARHLHGDGRSAPRRAGDR